MRQEGEVATKLKHGQLETTLVVSSNITSERVQRADSLSKREKPKNILQEKLREL